METGSNHTVRKVNLLLYTGSVLVAAAVAAILEAAGIL